MVQLRRSYGVIVLFLICSTCSASRLLAYQIKAVPPATFDSVVMVIAYFSDASIKTGTGFVIDNTIGNSVSIVTNHHVIDNAFRVLVRFQSDNVSHDCDQVDEIPGLDLAVLRLKQKPATNPPALALEAKDKPAVLLQDVLLIGHMVFDDGKLKLPWSAQTGKISAVNRDRGEIVTNQPNVPNAKVFQLDVTSAHGMSGSPVLNDHSKVIGVLFAGVDFGVSNVSFAVPRSYLDGLKMSNNPRNFQAGQNAPPIIQGGGVQNLNARQPMMQMVPGNGIKNWNSNDIPTVNVGALNWGAVNASPKEVIEKYVKDPHRFQEHVPEEILGLLMARHKLIHVTNPFFRYSVLVPDNFGIDESVPPDAADTLVTKFISNDYPAPLGQVTIVTRRIPRETPPNLLGELNKYARMFLREKVGLKMVGSPEPPGLPPPQDEIRLIPELSDGEPRIQRDGRMVRSWRRYRSLVRPNRDYAFFFGIVDDVFVVAHFAIDTQSAAFANDDLVERFMIASSISFSE